MCLRISCQHDILKIKSNIELPNGNYRVTLRGLFRASIKNLKNNNSSMRSSADLLKKRPVKMLLKVFENPDEGKYPCYKVDLSKYGYRE